MPSATSSRPPNRIAIFCDGTWVGRESTVEGASPSNIRQLANMVGEVQYTSDNTPAKVHPIKPHNTSSPLLQAVHGDSNIIAGYQEGVGLNGTFLDYIWDGATAASISEECIAVYRFIVENYTPEHEIWLFGFSRGAFTVRCVAGMINNCGIVKCRSSYTDTELGRLCYEVFRTYRSTAPVDHPKSEECRRWRGKEESVWQVARPVRFMGIIDTVGALGIPRLNAGVGFDWSPFEFFDQTVSSVVQFVYHAPCLHDRLWIFQPCLVYPAADSTDALEREAKAKAVVRQKWFPGCHYDVGRMTFRFLRQRPQNWIEAALGWLPDLLSRTIYPNQVLSDAVLRWIVEGIQEVDENSSNPLISNPDEQIQALSQRLITMSSNATCSEQEEHITGSGDIYKNILAYAPGGIVFSAIQRTSRHITGLLNSLLPQLGTNIQGLLGIKTLLSILTATADRRIPGTSADVYPYTDKEVVTTADGRTEVLPSVQRMGRMQDVDKRGTVRYPSETFQSFLLWKRVFGPEEVESEEEYGCEVGIYD